MSPVFDEPTIIAHRGALKEEQPGKRVIILKEGAEFPCYAHGLWFAREGSIVSAPDDIEFVYVSAAHPWPVAV